MNVCVTEIRVRVGYLDVLLYRAQLWQEQRTFVSKHASCDARRFRWIITRTLADSILIGHGRFECMTLSASVSILYAHVTRENEERDCDCARAFMCMQL